MKLTTCESLKTDIVNLYTFSLLPNLYASGFFFIQISVVICIH